MSEKWFENCATPSYRFKPLSQEESHYSFQDSGSSLKIEMDEALPSPIFSSITVIVSWSLNASVLVPRVRKRKLQGCIGHSFGISIECPLWVSRCFSTPGRITRRILKRLDAFVTRLIWKTGV